MAMQNGSKQAKETTDEFYNLRAMQTGEEIKI
jgi:hypothetical protein